MYNYKSMILSRFCEDKYIFDEEYVEFCNYMGIKKEIDMLDKKLISRCAYNDFLSDGNKSYIEYIMKNRDLRKHLFDYRKNYDAAYNTLRTIFQLDKKFEEHTPYIYEFINYPLFLYYGLCVMEYNNFEYDIKKIEDIKNDVLIEGYNKYFKDEIQILCKLYKDTKEKYDLDMLIIHYMDDPTEEIAYYVKDNFGSNIMKNDRLVKKVIEIYPDILGDDFKKQYKFEMYQKRSRGVKLPNCPIFKDMSLIIRDYDRFWFKNKMVISSINYKNDDVNRDDLYYSLIYFILSDDDDIRKIIYDTQLPKKTKLFVKRCYISDESPINKALFHEWEIKEYIYGGIIKKIMGLYDVNIKVETHLNDIYIEY